MSDALPRMLEALALEVAAIRKKGGGSRVELRGGEKVGMANGAWLYQFIAAEDISLRDDTPVRVTVGKEDVDGVIVSIRDGVLVVALDKDLGPKIASAQLVANDAFLIERLKEKLEKINVGETLFSRHAAERVLGCAPIRSGQAEPHEAVLRDGNANADQALAVRQSLGSETTYVWGPPGTGKTTTLARIVEAHYRAGHSVLLVSNTNMAVDTALERVADRLKGETDFHQGLVIRQGPVVKEELRQRFGPQVILEEIVARLGVALQREKEELRRESNPLEPEEKSLVAALASLQRLTSATQSLATGEKNLDAARHTAAERKREAAHHHESAARIKADLERSRTMGAVRRFFSGLNPEKLERSATSAAQNAQAATDAASALASDALKLEAHLLQLRTEVTQLSADTRSYPPEDQIADKLASLRSRLKTIRERIAAIDQQLAELEQQVLQHCRILATTVYRTYLGKSTPRQFDAVVIDEASMLMPPLVYYVAGLSTSSVTVAGDFRQLPPIVKSDEPLAIEWLKQDVFEKAGIPQLLERNEPTPHLVALGTQYRMREPICAIINELFYKDRPLRSDACVGRGTEGFPLSPAPILYVDTSAFHPWTAFRVGSYSRYNLLHGLLVRNIVLHLAETGFLPAAGEANEAVGAVAPYASQARLIQSLLDDRLGSRAAGIAATVHRFQGNEKRVMVLDLTDSLGAPLGKFLKATSIEEDGARLLNVAASRARHHVILVGNFEFLRAKAPSDGFVRRLVDLFEERGESLDLNQLLPLAERDWIDGLHRVLPANFDLPDGAAGAFTEGTFYPAFSTDLGRVRESIVIFSPFATGPGTDRWSDPLRAAIARGVRVRILTRPPEEFGGGGTDEGFELIGALRALGVAVDLRARMHEKIAILDGRILWHGSLNILSHRDTHESMLRLDSPAACSQLTRFVTTPTGPRDDAPSLDAPENPKCPTCDGPTVWNSGRYGIYFGCEDPGCDGKVDSRGRGQRPKGATGTRGSSARRSTPDTTRACPRDGCDGHLTERSGRFGPFMGCTKYPKCRHTNNVQ